MEQKRPRWVDKPEFDWTPEPPLYMEQPGSPWEAHKPRVTGAHFGKRDFAPANDTIPPSPLGHARQTIARGIAPLVGLVWLLGKRSGDAAGQFAGPDIVPRLAIGFGQGLLLSLLFVLRGAGPNIPLTGLIMATAFAPLLLVQGLGRISLRPLLTWVASAAIGLVGLGTYHAWRVTGADPGHAGLWLVAMTLVFLFIGQALLLAHARSTPLRYAVLYESSWRLAAETVLCGLVALSVWTLCKFGGHLFVPQATSLSQWFAIPLTSISFAAAAQLRAGTLLHLLKRSAVISFAFLLPPLIFFAAVTILSAAFGHWRPSLALCGLQGLLLLIGINASYRGGEEWRPLWRRRAEFLAAVLLPPLALLGVLALHTRVGQYGFTGPRIIAMASMLLFIAYGLTYAGAALISLGGGRWMARIERVNLPMAFVVMSLCATLASPLGDPVRLAVANQNWRMLHGRIAPEAFDYAYLSRFGLKFGRAVLEGRR
jgi:hypothetical protein